MDVTLTTVPWLSYVDFQKIIKLLIRKTKLLLIKKVNDEITVGFFQFLFEQTAHHKYFTSNLYTNITSTLHSSFSLNHTLLNKFITSSTHLLTFLQLSVTFNDSLAPVFYTDGSVDTLYAKARAA